MNYIVTHLTIETLTKLLTASKQCFGGFSLFLGEKWYKCCVNTPITFLTLIISQMLWIVTNFDYKHNNKAIYFF
ncbi:hypothetical protein AtNW77_Chr1g0041881 [Arabidopsis thaliana]